MSWLTPQESLSSLQKEAIILPPSFNRLILGGALTGKTQVLMYRAKYLQETLQLASDELRIWASCLGAQNLMRSVAHLVGLDPMLIETYDDWCNRVYLEVVGSMLPTNSLTNEVDAELIRIVARHAVNWGFAKKPTFYVLLLDDAHMFSEADVAFICGMGCHVTLCGRNCEPSTHLSASVGRGAVDITFAESYQRNQAIQQFVSRLQSNLSFDATKHPLSGAEMPFYFPANDNQTELNRLSEVLHERMLLNETIGILLPNPTLALQLAHDLVRCGLKVELDNTKAFPSPDFSSRCPKIYTHDQAQCLNFETIVIPRLTRSAYLGYSDDEIVNLLTDAANRATKWFYLSSSLPAALCNLDQFNRVSESVKIGKTPDPITAKKPVFKKPLVITPIDDLL